MTATLPPKREFIVQIRTSCGISRIWRWERTEADVRTQIEHDNCWRNCTGWQILEVRPAYPDLPPAKENRLTYQECLAKYPRLCALLADCLIESLSGAACCLRDYRSGLRFGSEAVSHSGLSPHDRVKQALDTRRILKQHWPDGYRRLIQRRECTDDQSAQHN